MQEIIEQIKVYIHEEKSDYAIMINGSWGCGKTYFVKNDLSYKLYDETCKPNIYISLFGIKSIEELYDLMAINILDIKNNENADKKSRMSGWKVNKREYYRLVSLTREAVAIKKGLKDLLNSFSIGKATTDAARSLSEGIISFKNYIFIFDDFERTTINKIDLLAFIDSLVEQNCAKVIIISNEFALLTNKKSNNNKKKGLMLSNNQNNKVNYSHVLKFVLPNPSKEDDSSYWNYKEKVIGLTIDFKYDIFNIFKNILDDYIENKECREFVMARKERIIKLFKTAQSNNFRTLEFVFKRFSEIYIDLTKLNYKLNYYDQYMNLILDNVVTSSIHYKEKSKLIEYDDDKFIAKKVWTKNGFDNYTPYSVFSEEILTWRAIDNYIQSYRIDIETLKLYIDDYITYLNSDSQGISMQIFNIMLIEDDSEACEALKKIQEKIYYNEYDINVYPHILDRLFKLYELLPVEDSIDNLKRQILKNAETKFNDLSQFSWNTFEYDNSEAKAFKEELFDYLKGNKQSNALEQVKSLLESEELFINNINSIFADNELAANRNKGYFVGLSGAKFAERLLKLPLRSIRELNTNLEHYYISTNGASVNYIKDSIFFIEAGKVLGDYLKNENLEIKQRTKYFLQHTLIIINQLNELFTMGDKN